MFKLGQHGGGGDRMVVFIGSKVNLYQLVKPQVMFKTTTNK